VAWLNAKDRGQLLAGFEQLAAGLRWLFGEGLLCRVSKYHINQLTGTSHNAAQAIRQLLMPSTSERHADQPHAMCGAVLATVVGRTRADTERSGLTPLATPR
jgi:hypothetical protein